MEPEEHFKLNSNKQDMTNCILLYLDNFYACVLKACLSLFVYGNTTVLELQTLLLFFCQNLGIQIEGAAYLVQSHLNQEEKTDVLDMEISTHLNIVAQNFTKVTIRKLKKKNKESIKCTFTNDKCASNVEITTEL